MTDETVTPTPATPEPPLSATEPAVGEPQAAAPGANRAALILGGVALALSVIVLAGGLSLWSERNAASAQIADLQGKLDSLAGRTGKLEARPVPQPPPPPPPPPNLQPLEQRLTALENKPAPEAQLDAAGQKQLADLSGRIDGIAARQNQLGEQEQTDLAKANERLSGLDTRVASLAQANQDLATLRDRQARIAQMQAAAAALAAGRPLGSIPGAPAALAKFATAAPPTEAQLRLSFDAAAADARRAGQPAAANAPFLTRLWDKAQTGVVVRDGDRVIVGDAVSGVLEHSKRQLDAGDLPGAVSVLDGLAGPAAAAMAPWRAQAQSLIDARTALISAARG